MYICSYAKEFCIKSISGRLSDGWHLDLTQLKRTWLVGKEWSSTEPCPSLWKKGKPCTTYLWLNKVQLKFHQSCGEIPFLLYCFNEMKKEIFWKAIFYLIWQIWPSSATRFPRCSLCNHMVQLLVKRADIMFLSTYILHILEWRSSHVWTFPFSGPLAQEGQEYQDSEHIIAILL